MHRLATTSTPAVLITASMFLLGCTSGSDPVAVPGADDVVTAPLATLDIDDVVEQPTGVDTDEPVATLPPLDDTEATSTTAAPSPTTTPPTTAPPTTAPPTTEVPADDGFLRIGDEGDEVGLMQLKLNALGYLPGNAQEGVFDRATADGLIDFQAQYGLVVDGIFGPETDRALTAAAQSVNPES